ncbi:MAG: peptidylprolyl isomerase [Flavobacteriales bacterium]|nr:putative bifunctional phosphatase/peptidyl-prolyl cis-trans isomerase [Flavobacteriales bacterium]MCC6576093.1 peptidylprolyl isomerase [Flavobacteriales bacterium]NUQ15712.1 peptidylprolyl isomerase [Flavobacteriales bacterium]
MFRQINPAKLAPSLLFLLFPLALCAQAGKDAKRPRVEVRTTLGTMIVELYNETPQHRDNFLKLARQHFYDSLIFHRVIPGFMVQGGDPDSKRAAAGMPLGMGGPGYTVPAEILPGMYHTKGVLAAARQGDQVNPTKASSGSQFYIVQGRTYQPQEMDMIAKRNASMGTPVTYDEAAKARYASVGGAPHLDGAYTVFGEVVEGLDVVDKIAAVQRDARDRPVEDIRMWVKVLP